MSTETITFQINEDYTVDIRKYHGSYGGEYYSVNGTNYDIHFPIEWVFQYPNEIKCPYFGPEECNMCAEYGFYNGVFIGYCIHCAKNANFSRGNGMINIGVEIDQKKANELGIPIKYNENNSMWNIYMQTADMCTIGDEELRTKHMSFFHDRKKIDALEMERVFDFYAWLNSNNPVPIYISEGEDDIPDLCSVRDNIDVKSIDSKPENNYKLSLVLPELESESE